MTVVLIVVLCVAYGAMLGAAISRDTTTADLVADTLRALLKGAKP